MIDDVDNCPYSYNKNFPGLFLYPDTVNLFVDNSDDIQLMNQTEKDILFQIILLANNQL
jgi:hypothetical protein